MWGKILANNNVIVNFSVKENLNGIKTFYEHDLFQFQIHQLKFCKYSN